MPSAEFDKFADDYLACHACNLRITGDDPEHFTRYKVDELRRRWTSRGLDEPARILDFGSGIGSSIPHFAIAFPGASLSAVDTSERSIEIAARRFSGLAEFVHYDGDILPFRDGTFDLIYSACVFHHIDPTAHLNTLRHLRAKLRPNGIMVVFEHNPINPVTRYIVATCPFDENAILISASSFKRAQLQAGFAEVDVCYIGYFPRTLAALRWLEPFLGRLPLGAQYYTFARG